jgi:hypothetical protein
MKTSRLATAAVASLIALTLAACTPASDPEPSASSSATVSDSPTPMPSPTDVPSPTATAAPDELDCTAWDDGLDEGGIAPIAANRYAGICAGMSFAEASGTFAGPPLTGIEVCPWITELVAMPDPGLYVEAISYNDAPGDEIFMFRMFWVGDPAAAPSFEIPYTAEGISIGSTTAQVVAAYPTGTAIVREDMAAGTLDQIVVPITDDYTYVFDVTGGLVNRMYWGERLAFGAQAELCAL